MKGWKAPPVELGHGRPVAPQLHGRALSAEVSLRRVRRGRLRQDPSGRRRDGQPHHDALGDHGQVRPREEDRARRRRVGRVVRAAAGQHAGFPRPAEQRARRADCRAPHQHLRAPCRPRPHGQHRPDDQRAAGDDHHRQREDGPDADVPRVQDVPAVSGRDVRSGDVRRGRLYARQHHAAPRRRDRREGRGRHALAGAHECRSEPARRHLGTPCPGSRPEPRPARRSRGRPSTA